MTKQPKLTALLDTPDSAAGTGLWRQCSSMPIMKPRRPGCTDQDTGATRDHKTGLQLHETARGYCSTPSRTSSSTWRGLMDLPVQSLDVRITLTYWIWHGGSCLLSASNTSSSRTMMTPRPGGVMMEACTNRAGPWSAQAPVQRQSMSVSRPRVDGALGGHREEPDGNAVAHIIKGITAAKCKQRWKRWRWRGISVDHPAWDWIVHLDS